MQFSVIVPIYNVEKYLRQCLDSVLSQEFKDFELILVDDGSTDESPRICDEYAKADSRITVVHKNNSGAADARNEGLCRARGEYIIFIDSDDYWDDGGALGKIKEVIDRECADIVTWRFKKLFEETGKIIPVGSDVDTSRKTFSRDMIMSRSLLSSANMKAMNAKLFKKNDLMFESGVLIEDVEWSARVICAAEKICPSNLDFYVYRQRSGSASHTLGKKNIQDLRKHIGSIERLIATNGVHNRELAQRYLAEEFVNFVVILTAYKDYREEIEWVRKNKHLLKWASTRKAKIMRLMLKIIGVGLTIRIIRKIR